MKGIVFTHYLDFIENRYDYDLVDQVIRSAELKSQGAYTSVGSYDFYEMVSLLTHTSRLKSVTVSDLLRDFGFYILPEFHKSFPHFFEGTRSCFDFLMTLENKIHPQVNKLYPDAELPRFDIEHPKAEILIMVYRSKRALGDFAEGLLLGTIHHFGENVSLTKELLKADGTEIRFVLKRA